MRLMTVLLVSVIGCSADDTPAVECNLAAMPSEAQCPAGTFSNAVADIQAGEYVLAVTGPCGLDEVRLCYRLGTPARWELMVDDGLVAHAGDAPGGGDTATVRSPAIGAVEVERADGSVVRICGLGFSFNKDSGQVLAPGDPSVVDGDALLQCCDGTMGTAVVTGGDKVSDDCPSFPAP